MRSARSVVLPGILLLAMIASAAAAARADGPAIGAVPTRADVAAAVAKLKSDPNLGVEREIRSLRWIRSGSPAPAHKPFAWVGGLFEYLSRTASALMWLAGAVCTGLAAVFVRRVIRERAPPGLEAPAPALAQVSGMDIRPESLPDDVGAAAMRLLDAGRMREALSLLYRGALSRAVHRFGVVIGESYTESEALRAAQMHLDAARGAFLAELVGMRLRAVYAGETVESGPARRLCIVFPSMLESP